MFWTFTFDRGLHFWSGLLVLKFTALLGFSRGLIAIFFLNSWPWGFSQRKKGAQQALVALLDLFRFRLLRASSLLVALWASGIIKSYPLTLADLWTILHAQHVRRSFSLVLAHSSAASANTTYGLQNVLCYIYIIYIYIYIFFFIFSLCFFADLCVQNESRSFFYGFSGASPQVSGANGGA